MADQNGPATYVEVRDFYPRDSHPLGGTEPTRAVIHAGFRRQDDGSLVCVELRIEPVEPDGHVIADPAERTAVIAREAVQSISWERIRARAELAMATTGFRPRDEDLVLSRGTATPYLTMEMPPTGDSWYADFAQRYQLAQALSTAPQQLFAEANKIPISRVRRYAYEARRRGYLPPDPRGRRKP